MLSGRRVRGPGRALVVALSSVALAAGCSGPDHRPETAVPGQATTQTPRPAEGGDADGAGCPVSDAAPDPRRPVVRLTFRLADDLATVSGSEDVVFTPDLPITELVFRLTPDTPSSVRAGTSIALHRVSVDGRPARIVLEAAGAGADSAGGLLRVPLPAPVAAGHAVHARIEFTLHLGAAGFDRFGHTGTVAWWGSGQPLLAWERAVGWHREPLSALLGETATSEAADTGISVTAPAALSVFGTGGYAVTGAGRGTRTWHAHADTARDVAVVAGRLRHREVRAGPTSVLVAGTDDPMMAAIAGPAIRAVEELTKRFGPFPFPRVSLVAVPANGGGIEYPGAILLAGVQEGVVTHEIAHQWFYAMVGNSQARDPWLDEAFATYSQQLVDDRLDLQPLGEPGSVGDPMASWARHPDRYDVVVYAKGAAMLAAARAAAGARRFDAEMRCYVRVQAWRVARPADVATAFAGLPAAVAVFRRAGAVR